MATAACPLPPTDCWPAAQLPAQLSVALSSSAVGAAAALPVDAALAAELRPSTLPMLHHGCNYHCLATCTTVVLLPSCHMHAACRATMAIAARRAIWPAAALRGRLWLLLVPPLSNWLSLLLLLAPITALAVHVLHDP